jgi:hypothetical protein
MKKLFLLALCCFLSLTEVFSWGFFAHKRINRLAVFSLPPEMVGFFKDHLQYITENAVNPDRRRYAVVGEAEKHFIDADAFGDSAVYKLPRHWQQAVEMYTEDSLRKYGIGPWNAYRVKLQLTEAFKNKNQTAILRLSADLGHYLADINVPLHTTKNYNGQLTDQIGIHAFWESRIPELLADDYDLFIGKAEYLPQPQLTAWEAVIQAHEALDSVLIFEKELSKKFPADKKYSYEERGNINTRVYSKEFTRSYHQMLDGQVERQMKKSIKMIADFWYTAWVDAGQPDLKQLRSNPLPDEDPIPQPEQNLQIREHEGSLTNRDRFLAQLWRRP